ncbi:hypothetical protein F5148DRAFT_1151183 [Russula earlei]|uniref:Uncharacterized protein n=1 Tax=Russula earlei TaxID=71964 RepID=A0ACC0U2B1_9AGAM|nr:hypothetical protein F5148DRAFT_1151183 [Russula earlei]
MVKLIQYLQIQPLCSVTLQFVQTQQPWSNGQAATALFLQVLDYLPELSNSDLDINDEQFLGIEYPHTWGEGPDMPAPHFVGDFFGDNYAEEDFKTLAMDDGVLPPDSDSDNCDNFNQEQGWEEPAAPNPSRSPSPEGEVFENNKDIPSVEERQDCRGLLPNEADCPHILQCAPIPTASEMPGYAGYKDQFVDELLKLEGLPDLLGLSYKNATELNKIIDKQLPLHPRFQRKEIIIAGEAYNVYFHDIIACIKVLYSDPQFTGILVFTLEQHYANPDMGIRLYHDMHTGKWWWETQKSIISLHIMAKSSLAIFLPLDFNKSPTMHLIIMPLKEASVSGIYMASGDGIICRCHPIFANYVGDYPEQLLVTLVKNGECPTCEAPHDELGKDCNTQHPLQNLDNILDALASVSQGSMVFAQNCRDAGIKPIYCPFWEDLPYANVYHAIMPDILHKLYQGVIKHMVSWIIQAYGVAEIDAWCHRLPPNHNICLFFKGISTLSRVTGREHDQMCCFILDNYNMEYTECLHIGLAKDAYWSTNNEDKFTQMTIWLERREKIFFHDRFIQWQIAGEPPPADTSWHAPQFAHHPHIQMTIHPSV